MIEQDMWPNGRDRFVRTSGLQCKDFIADVSSLSAAFKIWCMIDSRLNNVCFTSSRPPARSSLERTSGEATTLFEGV